MTTIEGTSRQQTKFLRGCVKDPWGIVTTNWPSATLLRKWMRRKEFRVAIQAIRDALRFRADVHIAAASAAAAQILAQSVMSDQPLPPEQHEKLKSAKEHIASLTTLLRLAHLRQRFSADSVEPPEQVKLTPEVRQAVEEMAAIVYSGAHEKHTIGEAKELFARMGFPRDPRKEKRPSAA